MERVHCFEKEQKVLFGERFQKKVNITIKSKKNTKELLKEYTKSTPDKRPYDDVSPQPPFRQGPHPSSLGQEHHSYQNQGFVPRDGLRKFYSRGGRGNLELQSPCEASIQHKSETKNTRPFKLLFNYQKVQPFVKTLSRKTRENIPLAERLKYFLKN